MSFFFNKKWNAIKSRSLVRVFFDRVIHGVGNNTRLSMQGFTLVEIMIVIGLIMIFTTMGLGVSRGSDEQTIFLKNRSLAMHAVYQAREYAMAIKGKKCGYGIRVQNGSLQIISSLLDPATQTCPDTGISHVQSEETIELDQATVAGSFTLLFEAPFGEQQKLGDPCFVLSGKNISSVIEINDVGLPYINVDKKTCN